jgi:hypothetical protein
VSGGDASQSAEPPALDAAACGDAIVVFEQKKKKNAAAKILRAALQYGG